MNYLAHIYLSGNNDFLKIGNFIADSIHGNNYLELPKEIREGIILHRKIDTFTDAHPVFRKSKHRLHENYGHYSGVIMDIFYDHFLAKNWQNYSTIPLEKFATDFYTLLDQNFSLLPSKVQRFLPTMKQQNWLKSYASIEGIATILLQMDYRTKMQSKMQFATKELQEFYLYFEEEFTLFFADVQQMVQKEISSFTCFDLS